MKIPFSVFGFLIALAALSAAPKDVQRDPQASLSPLLLILRGAGIDVEGSLHPDNALTAEALHAAESALRIAKEKASPGAQAPYLLSNFPPRAFLLDPENFPSSAEPEDNRPIHASLHADLLGHEDWNTDLSRPPQKPLSNQADQSLQPSSIPPKELLGLRLTAPESTASSPDKDNPGPSVHFTERFALKDHLGEPSNATLIILGSLMFLLTLDVLRMHLAPTHPEVEY